VSFQVRPPTAADAEEIFRLTSEANLAILGPAENTLAEIVQSLSRQGVDDGWLVLDEEGRAVNYGAVAVGANRRHVLVWLSDPAAPQADWLLETATRRAQELAGENGYSEAVIEAGLRKPSEVSQELLAAHGFEHSITFHLMRTDHTAPVVLPDLPAGAKLAVGAYDDATRHAAYDVLASGFDEDAAVAMPPYEEWVRKYDAWKAFDWSQLLVIELDGRAVAAAVNSNRLYPNAGYVVRLSVVPDARGRGLARWLLLYTFAAAAAAGLEATMLHVDTTGAQPALGLYESVGMRAVSSAELWDRRLPSR
jgi:mycothiol synthase